MDFTQFTDKVQNKWGKTLKMKRPLQENLVENTFPYVTNTGLHMQLLNHKPTHVAHSISCSSYMDSEDGSVRGPCKRRRLDSGTDSGFGVEELQTEAAGYDDTVVSRAEPLTKAQTEIGFNMEEDKMEVGYDADDELEGVSDTHKKKKRNKKLPRRG